MRIGLISLVIGLAALAAVLGSPAVFAAEAGRRTIPLDQDWRFHRGEVDGGQAAGLDDSSWRRLDVPHDWSIEGPFNQASPSGAGGGYLDGGIGWYRKSFVPPPEATHGRLFVEFDGVYMDSQVWLNGKLLGRHPYGYTGFQYDLTPHLKPGVPNVLAVRANVTQPCSRWYSGAGIFRHVRLTVTNNVHIAHWGTYVNAAKVADDAAVVNVSIVLQNQGTAAAEVGIRTSFLDPAGAEVFQAGVATRFLKRRRRSWVPRAPKSLGKHRHRNRRQRRLLAPHPRSSPAARWKSSRRSWSRGPSSGRWRTPRSTRWSPGSSLAGTWWTALARPSASARSSLPAIADSCSTAGTCRCKGFAIITTWAAWARP